MFVPQMLQAHLVMNELTSPYHKPTTSFENKLPMISPDNQVKIQLFPPLLHRYFDPWRKDFSKL
jgi:hypothetical protein